MLLFLTREAFCSRSMEERRTGDGDPDRPEYKLFSEFVVFLFCQNIRGEVVLSRGEDWNGEESVLRASFCEASELVFCCLVPSKGGLVDRLTFVV